MVVLRTAGLSGYLWRNNIMASIVQPLATRSISGHDLGIDVHKHDNDLLLMFSKQKGYERCNTHFLERSFLEKTEYSP